MSYRRLEFDLFEKIIVPAIDSFYTTSKDKDLLDRDASERAIVANIYCKMNLLFQKSDTALQYLSIDYEYNRNLLDTKKAYLKCNLCKLNTCIKLPYSNLDEADIVPDIIIHKRGSNEDNQVVIEFKKVKNRDEKQRKNDIAKLTYLTCQQQYEDKEDFDYKYQLGYFIDLDTDSYLVTSYTDAHLLGTRKRKEGRWYDV